MAPVEADLIVGYQHDRYHRLSSATGLCDLLVEANLSLITRAVRGTRSRALAPDDVRQAATLGLLTALAKFRSTSGAPFAAYAHHWIRKEIQRALGAGEHSIAIPANAGSLLRVVAAAATEQPGATDHQLAATVHLPEAKVGALRTVIATTSHDRIPELSADDPTEDIARRLGVHSALDVLDPTSRKIVLLRYGFDGAEQRSHRQIAQALSISDFTVRRRLQQAHERLAHYLG